MAKESPTFQKEGHPGSTHVPKMPGVMKNPAKIGGVSKDVNYKQHEGTGSGKGNGSKMAEIHPSPTKASSGSAKQAYPSSGSQKGAYGLYKKYDY